MIFPSKSARFQARLVQIGEARPVGGALRHTSAMALHEAPIPFITLPNWVKAAAQCGFNIEPVFRELGIQTDLIHLEGETPARC